MDQECPDHGDASMTECKVCGHEFCRACFSGARACPSCIQEQGVGDETDDDEPAAAESIDNLDELLAVSVSDDVDKLLDDADLLAGETDLKDDEDP